MIVLHLFFDWWLCHGRCRNVVGESFRSRNHTSIRNIFKLLLVLTLISLFVYIFDFFKTFVFIYSIVAYYGSISMVCTWSFSRGDCNIHFSTTHCCSNLSIERTESITLVIILYLIHLAAWSDLIYFIKNIYYLPTGGNIVDVFKFSLLKDAEAIRMCSQDI